MLSPSTPGRIIISGLVVDNKGATLDVRYSKPTREKIHADYADMRKVMMVFETVLAPDDTPRDISERLPNVY